MGRLRPGVRPKTFLPIFLLGRCSWWEGTRPALLRGRDPKLQTSNTGGPDRSGGTSVRRGTPSGPPEDPGRTPGTVGGPRVLSKLYRQRGVEWVGYRPRSGVPGTRRKRET